MLFYRKPFSARFLVFLLDIEQQKKMSESKSKPKKEEVNYDYVAQRVLRPNDGRLSEDLYEVIQIPPEAHPFKYENIWETELCDFFEDCDECESSSFASNITFTLASGLFLSLFYSFQSVTLTGATCFTFADFTVKWTNSVPLTTCCCPTIC